METRLQFLTATIECHCTIANQLEQVGRLIPFTKHFFCQHLIFFFFFFISPRPAQCRNNRGGGGDVIHFAAAGPTLRRRMTLGPLQP